MEKILFFLTVIVSILTPCFGSLSFVQNDTTFGNHQVYPAQIAGNGSPIVYISGVAVDSVCDIPVSFTYSGTSSNISYKITRKSDDSIITDWAVLHASAETGSYVDTVQDLVWNDFWYKILLKGTVSTDTCSSAQKWGVGINIAPWGQSNIKDLAGDSACHTAIDEAGLVYLNGITKPVWCPLVDTWITGVAVDSQTSMVVPMVNNFHSLLNRKVVVGVAGHAASGSSLNSAVNALGWNLRDGTNPQNTAYVYGLLLRKAKFAKAMCFINNLGETDAGIPTSNLLWTRRYDTLHTRLITDLGYRPRMFTIQIMQWSYPGIIYDSVYTIQRANFDVANDTDVYRLAVSYDMPFQLGKTARTGYHLTTHAQSMLGNRCGTNLAHWFNCGNTLRGPRCAGIDTVTSRGNVRMYFATDSSATLEPHGSAVNFDLGLIYTTLPPLRRATISNVTAGTGYVDLSSPYKTFLNPQPMLIRYAYGYGSKDSALTDSYDLPAEPWAKWDTIFIDTSAIHAATDRYFKKGDPLNDSAWSATSGGAGGAGVPDSTMDVIFDGNANNACTLTGAVKWRSATALRSYTAAFNQNGKRMDLYGSFDWDAANSITLSGKQIINTDGDFYLSYTGTITSTADTLYMKGNGYWDDYETSQILNVVHAAYTGKTVIKDMGNSNGCAQLVLHGGKFMISNAGTNSFFISGTYLSPFIDSGAQASIINIFDNAIYFYATNTSTATITFPKIKISYLMGAVYNGPQILFAKTGANSNVTFVFSDSVLLWNEYDKKHNNFVMRNVVATGTAYFKAPPYVDCYEIGIGNSVVGAIGYATFANSTINCRLANFAAYNVGAFYDSLKNSTWNIFAATSGGIASYWKPDTAHNIIKNVSTINFSGYLSPIIYKGNKNGVDDINVNLVTGANYALSNSGAMVGGDITITNGKYIAGTIATDTVRCVDFTANNTTAGDSVLVNAPVILTGVFSCAAGVIFKYGASGKIIMPNRTAGINFFFQRSK